MLNSYYRLSVPDELAAFYKVTSPAARMSEKTNFDSDLVICRDARGCIASVKYFTPEKELLKEVFYKGESICKINQYRGKVLYSTTGYKDGLPVLKFIFQSSGHLAYSVEYEYKKAKMTGIRKKCQGREIYVKYQYDDFERISHRSISLNNEQILQQSYRYDILDRIVEYKDNNQKIVVNKISKKNELISYVITDKMNNDIAVENHFTESGYVNTDITVNGHCSQVKDTSYVDNVMLKKPYTSEDDLDLIIANLFRDEHSMQTSRNNDKYSGSMIEQSIEHRTLPISMRKRLLYSMAVNVS